MIVAEVRSTPIETNIGEAARRFKIKASARAFKILSSFYTDPMAAIPRELGANAWDAHVKAGNTSQPFEVHVPNTLESWFSIRDFGTGLSKEDVYTIYTTYFESTKGSSNDFDGCMGLGSKTPFNYTENFNVTVWFGGIKYTYNCFVDEEGGPSILLIDETPSSEPNGLMVKFGVKQDDVRTFVEKIRHSYAAFRVKPKLTGIHDINYPEIKYAHRGANGDWGIRASDNYSRYDRRCVAMMGNYRYPIDANLVAGYSECKGVTKEEKEQGCQMIRSSNLELAFNIGDLDVAPNKETLQYDADDRTRAAILKAASKAYVELWASVLAKIATPKTMWEAMKLYHSVNSFNDNGCYLREIIGVVSIPYGGGEVTRSNITVHDAISKTSGGAFSAKFELYQLSYNVGADRFKTRETNTLEASHDNLHIFYTNSDGIKRSRIRQFLRTKFSQSEFPQTYLIVDQSANFADMWAIQSTLGMDKAAFHHIESLPKPPAPKRTPVGVVGPKEKITDGLLCTPVSYLTQSVRPGVAFSTRTFEIDPNGTYYYVPMKFLTSYVEVKEGKKVVDTKEINDVELSWLLKYATDEEIVPKTGAEYIFGINVKSRKVMRVGTWINVLDLAYHKAKKAKTSKIEQILFESESHSSIREACGNFHRLFSSYQDAESKAFIDNLESEKTRMFFKNLRSLNTNNRPTLNEMDNCFRNLFNVKPVEHKPYKMQLIDVTEILTDKYFEVFSLLDCYSSGGAKIAKIINFIDRNTKTS